MKLTLTREQIPRRMLPAAFTHLGASRASCNA